jgi:hypothetical protein
VDVGARLSAKATCGTLTLYAPVPGNLSAERAETQLIDEYLFGLTRGYQSFKSHELTDLGKKTHGTIVRRSMRLSVPLVRTLRSNL